MKIWPVIVSNRSCHFLNKLELTFECTNDLYIMQKRMPRMNKEVVSFEQECQSVFMKSILFFFSEKHSWSKQQKTSQCHNCQSLQHWVIIFRCMSVQVKGSWFTGMRLMLVMRSLFDQKCCDYYIIVWQEKKREENTP